jgi:hypothetical protein
MHFGRARPRDRRKAAPAGECCGSLPERCLVPAVPGTRSAPASTNSTTTSQSPGEMRTKVYGAIKVEDFDGPRANTPWYDLSGRFRLLAARRASGKLLPDAFSTCP